MNKKELIDSFKESSQKEVVGAVQGTYKFKKSLMKQKFGDDSATKKSLNWGFAYVKNNIGKYFSWKDAENSFREMSKIAKILADYCKEKNHS